MKNIQAENYFEHIGTIQTANFFYTERDTEYLYLLVLTSKKADFTNTENIPLERYDATLEKWQVYQNQTIYKVLEDFKNKSSISLLVYFVDKNIIEANDLEDEVEPLTKNFILIADTFSLQFSENQNFARLFDTKDQQKIGGCLIPICIEYAENQRNFAQTQVQQTFKRLTKAWGTEFYKSYAHVELDIPNKTHFFRRLANIAYFKGIKEKETMKKFEAQAKRFQNPTRP